MNVDKYIEAYLKDKFLSFEHPEGGYKPTSEDWERMPQEHKQMMIDLVKDFPLIKYVIGLCEKKYPVQSVVDMMKEKIREFEKS